VALEVLHQSGERWIENARASYVKAGISARVQPFIEDMAEAYGWADLVVCRSGALTVSELAAAGVGSVLVPFAAATDNHQSFNAAYLVNAGAAVMIAERELDTERLAAELARLCADRMVLLTMADRARALASPRATEQLADACAELAGVAA
jgi:UDP-N-acetylglucosamine--N-acetylmuramyl-(pentapeptide) pyrophosphoryl-undecaprenol N-acetylglucosamine transferase